jgi:hypothetical protein
MSTINSAEVPCATLSGMGLGPEDAGMSVTCLRIAHAVVATAASQRIHQNTESPFGKCNR